MKCWNEEDKKEDVMTLIKAIVKTNLEIKLATNLSERTLISKIRDRVLTDPLLEGALLKERLE